MPRAPAFDRDRLAALARRLDADVADGAIPGAVERPARLPLEHQPRRTRT